MWNIANHEAQRNTTEKNAKKFPLAGRTASILNLFCYYLFNAKTLCFSALGCPNF